MRVAYFTGGTVGAGHLTRGLAIERALARNGVSATFRVFAPHTPLDARVRYSAAITTVTIDPIELTDPSRAPRSDLARELTAFAPDVLVVDLFWAPLRYILPLTGTAAWLLLRACPPAWMRGPPGVPFDRSQYACIVAIEPLPFTFDLQSVPPIVCCNPDECAPPGALRARWGIDRDTRLTVVNHAGRAGEIDTLLDEARRTATPGEAIRVADLHAARDATLHPLAPWLGDADRIVAGAGYNTFWETRWLARTERTHLRAFARTIDDQSFRLRAGPAYPMRENGADVLARMLRG